MTLTNPSEEPCDSGVLPPQENVSSAFVVTFTNRPVTPAHDRRVGDRCDIDMTRQRKVAHLDQQAAVLSRDLQDFLSTVASPDNHQYFAISLVHEAWLFQRQKGRSAPAARVEGMLPVPAALYADINDGLPAGIDPYVAVLQRLAAARLWKQ
jgi:hypothetical protein